MIEQVAAALISGVRPFDFEPPSWYMQVGHLLAWLGAAGTWMICLVAFGWTGLFLGWIPALITYAITKPLWPFGLAYLLWYLLR